eukprot:Nk52_evm57s153 gene=Nk52_evmTU57s153
MDFSKAGKENKSVAAKNPLTVLYSGKQAVIHCIAFLFLILITCQGTGMDDKRAGVGIFVNGNEVIRIAGFLDTFQSFQYMAASRVLDRNTGTDSTEQQFHFFSAQSGMHIYDALRDGYVQMGVIGSVPFTAMATRINAANAAVRDFNTSMSSFSSLVNDNQLVVFYIDNVLEDEMEALVIRSSLNISEPRDILQRTSSGPLRIGTPFGSTSHFYLIVGLSIYGLNTAVGPKDPDDTTDSISSQIHVHIIYMTPAEIETAFEIGTIDGAFVWNPTKVLLKSKFSAKHLLGPSGISLFRTPVANLWTTTMGFWKKHPDIVQHVLNTLKAVNDNFLKLDSVTISQWGPGGAIFDKMVKFIHGDTNAALLPENGYPYGASIESGNRMRVEGKLNHNAQVEFFGKDGLRNTIFDHQNYLKSIKILNTDAVKRANISQFYITDQLAKASSSSLTFADLVEKPYDSTRYTAVPQTCNSSSPVEMKVTSSPQTLTLYGHTDTSISCRWVFMPENVSSTDTFATLTFTSFQIYGVEGIILYTGDASTQPPTDTLGSQKILYTHRGSVPPAAPMLVRLPVVLMVDFLKSELMPLQLLGWVPHGKNVIQSLVLQYISVSQGCTSSAQCISLTPNAFCREPSASSPKRFCECPSGYSGAFCTIPHCSGNRVFHSSTGKTIKIYTTAFASPSLPLGKEARSGYPHDITCRFKISAPQSPPTSSDTKQTLWGFHLNFTNLRTGIEHDQDSYTVLSREANSSKIASVISMPSIGNDSSDVYVQGNETSIVFQAGNVGGRIGSVILCTPIYVWNTQSPHKKAVQEMRNVSLTKAYSRSTFKKHLASSRNFNIQSTTCLHGSICKCDLGLFGDNCWSDQCLTSNTNFTDVREGRIVSQGAQFYEHGRKTCSWWIRPPFTNEAVATRNYSRAVEIEGISLLIQKLDLEPVVDFVLIKGYDLNGTVVSEKAFAIQPFFGCGSDSGCQGDGSTCNVGNQSVSVTNDGRVRGICQCADDRIGPLCEYKREQGPLKGVTFEVIAAFDSGLNLDRLGNVAEYEGFDFQWSAYYPCEPTNCIPPIGQCIQGVCVCSEGRVGSQCIEEHVMCELTRYSKYSFFEQSSYAWDVYDYELTTLTILVSALVVLFLASLIYILLMYRKVQTFAHFHFHYSVLLTFANIVVIASLIMETILINTLALSADLTWLRNSRLEDIVNFRISESHVDIGYFCIALIFLWCVYCIIYLTKQDSSTERHLKAVGSVLMAPSLVYLRIIGSTGIVPLVGQLFSYFPCAYIPEHAHSALIHYCKIECFSEEHETIMVLSFTALMFFIPGSLLTGHFWQDICAGEVDSAGIHVMTIHFRRGYILATQVAFYIVIACRTFIFEYTEIYLGIFIVVWLLMIAFHVKVKHVVNILWLDEFIYAQYVSGLTSATIALAAHRAGVNSIWPISAVVVVALLIYLAAFAISRKVTQKNNPYFRFRPTPNVKNNSRKLMNALIEELTTMRRQSMASAHYSITEDGFQVFPYLLEQVLAVFPEAINAYSPHPKDYEFIELTTLYSLRLSHRLFQILTEKVQSVNSTQKQEHVIVARLHACIREYIFPMLFHSSHFGVRIRSSTLKDMAYRESSTLSMSPSQNSLRKVSNTSNIISPKITMDMQSVGNSDTHGSGLEMIFRSLSSLDVNLYTSSGVSFPNSECLETASPAADDTLEDIDITDVCEGNVENGGSHESE